MTAMTTTTYSCDRCGEEMEGLTYQFKIPQEGGRYVFFSNGYRDIDLCDPCAKGLAEYLKVNL